MMGGLGLGDAPSELVQQTCFSREADLRYLLSLPEGYQPQARNRWPLVLYLHGGAVGGDTLEWVATEGLPHMVEEGRRFPFVLVSPQCPIGPAAILSELIGRSIEDRTAEHGWNRCLDRLELLLGEVSGGYAIDPARVYLVGLSMGGFGAWALAAAHPAAFAAVVQIYGGGDPSKAVAYRDVAVWSFAGEKDQVEPWQRTAEMVEAINAAGGQARVMIYRGLGHGAAVHAALSSDELYDWLLAQRKRDG